MVNPSSLASAAAAAATALGVGGETAAPGVGLVRQAVVAAARKAAKAGSPSAAAAKKPLPFLLDPATVRSLASALGAIVSGRAPRAPVAGYAARPAPASSTSTSRAATTSTSSSSSASKSALSFLSDPKLSIEEKLMRLMAYLNDKYEKEMQAKMDELAGKKTTSSSSSTKKKSSGILGKIGSALSSVVGGDVLKSVTGFLNIPGVKSVLGKIAGPVLAAGASALGFPMAAPLLLKYGSQIVDVAAGVAGEAASTSSSSSGSTSGSSGPKNEQTMMMELQRLNDKQKEMFGMISNILKANHDTRMSVINNLR